MFFCCGQHCAVRCVLVCACVCLCVCWADNDPTQQHTWDDPTQIYYPRGQEEHLAPAHAVRFVVMRNSTYKLIYRVKGSTPGGGPDRCVIVRPIPADPRPTMHTHSSSTHAAQPLAITPLHRLCVGLCCENGCALWCAVVDVCVVAARRSCTT